MNLRKFLVVSSAGIAVLILSWVVFLGAVYAWSGVATVRVKDVDEGINLFIPVPMALVEVAASTAAWGHSDHFRLEMDAHRDQLGELVPLVRTMLAELEDCPDVTLVEVESDRSRVKVKKQRGDLVVEVDDDGVAVRVSLPVRSVRRMVAKLASI